MEQALKTALVLGATGLVGGKLVEQLLHDDRYAAVRVFGRRKLDREHPKLEEFIGDLLQFESFAHDFVGDEVFCCIGTTKAKTPDQNSYYKIDYGIPVAAARLAQKKRINTFLVVSALGADPKSPIFYNRVKGEMEASVLALDIPKTHIVQPSLIGGNRQEKRAGESLFKGLLGVLNGIMIGPLQKYRMILPDTIAAAMIWLANNEFGEKRVESEQLKELVA